MRPKRRWYTDQNRIRLFQALRITRCEESVVLASVLDSAGADVQQRTPSLIQIVHLIDIDIETDDPKTCFASAQGERQANVAEAYHGEQSILSREPFGKGVNGIGFSDN